MLKSPASMPSIPAIPFNTTERKLSKETELAKSPNVLPSPVTHIDAPMHYSGRSLKRLFRKLLDRVTYLLADILQDAVGNLELWQINYNKEPAITLLPLLTHTEMTQAQKIFKDLEAIRYLNFIEISVAPSPTNHPTSKVQKLQMRSTQLNESMYKRTHKNIHNRTHKSASSSEEDCPAEGLYEISVAKRGSGYPHLPGIPSAENDAPTTPEISGDSEDDIFALENAVFGKRPKHAQFEVNVPEDSAMDTETEDFHDTDNSCNENIHRILEGRDAEGYQLTISKQDALKLFHVLITLEQQKVSMLLDLLTTPNTDGPSTSPSLEPASYTSTTPTSATPNSISSFQGSHQISKLSLPSMTTSQAPSPLFPAPLHQQDLVPCEPFASPSMLGQSALVTPSLQGQLGPYIPHTPSEDLQLLQTTQQSPAPLIFSIKSSKLKNSKSVEKVEDITQHIQSDATNLQTVKFLGQDKNVSKEGKKKHQAKKRCIIL